MKRFCRYIGRLNAVFDDIERRGGMPRFYWYCVIAYAVIGFSTVGVLFALIVAKFWFRVNF